MYMNLKIIESSLDKPNCKKMNLQTFCNWFALCNALKFINNGCELSGKYVDENDLDYRGIINYVNSVGGDIMTCVKQTKGIPFKYCLNNKTDDFEIEDISYEFLSK
jgi:hypothetical protein